MASLLKKHIINQQIFTKTGPSLNIFYDEMQVKVKEGKKIYGERFKLNPLHQTSHIKFFTNPRKENDVPINVGSEEEMWDELRKASTSMSGINFALGIRTDEGQLQVWKRPSQPCQGGEMRKYGITHDDCTRPKDKRPGDLYYPFPDGTPLAVCSKFGKGVKYWYSVYVNDTSPYRRAYGNEDNIELVRDKGVLVKDASLIDPTMLVYFFRKLRDGSEDFFDSYLFKELTPIELVLFDLIGWKGCNFNKRGESSMYDVRKINLKQFLKGGVEASYDLTGGSLKDRYDYNRPEIEYVFAGAEDHKDQITFGKINDFVFNKKPPQGKDGLIKDLTRIREKLAELAA